jgi:F-type H+-transporting ATPase subunit b
MMKMKLFRTLPLLLISTPAWAGDAAPWMEIALHAFNLSILLGVLFYFFGRKVKAMVAQRAADIQVAVDQANEARKAAQLKAEALDMKLRDLEGQLAQIRSQAEVEAAQEAEAILARAEVDAASIREAAERTIRDETARARQSLRTEAVSLAIQLAGQQLESQITADDQKRLAADFLSAVETGGSTEVANG